MGFACGGQRLSVVEWSRVGWSRVFQTWAELFALGPRVLRLTGSFAWAEEAESSQPDAPRGTVLNGDYERLEFDRDQVVGVLKQLAQYAKRVRFASGRWYVLHYGV